MIICSRGKEDKSRVHYKIFHIINTCHSQALGVVCSICKITPYDIEKLKQQQKSSSRLLPVQRSPSL